MERSALELENSPLVGDGLTTLIGLAGEVKGVVLLGMNEANALRIAGQMAGEELSVLDELARSAVAELTNMLSGRAATDLEQLGHAYNIRSPTLVTGVGTEFSTTSVQRVVVPLAAPCGAVDADRILAQGDPDAV